MESKMMYHAGHLPSPVNLEISHHPLSMRRVVNVVIAMEHMKNSVAQSLLSPGFGDENLLSNLFENMIEEVVEPKFTRVGEHYCSVTDNQKRVLVQESLKLHAVILQGGSVRRQVQLNLSTYRPPVPSAEERPVALGIRDTDYYLSCHKEGTEPSLHLETVADKGVLQNIISGSEMTRFIFYKHDTGLNLSSLRSARFPEWYISTAEMDHQPIQMRAQATSYSTFSFQSQN
uniref:Interleukin-1 n=1 Tax=Periophthalmus magnuspinnatus TaxID=409849 RepID=A0A3B4BHS8_9GOBI